MNIYVALDTETGGIGSDKSLLTAYFGFFRRHNDEDFKQFDELSLAIKPKDGVYKVTAESLSINKIDLIKHDKIAISEQQAGTLLYDKLASISSYGNEKIIPIGHNVSSDINKICSTLMSKKSWDNFVSYRCLDTCVVAQFLRTSELIPEEVSCSLSNLVKYFDIKIEGTAHEAKYDTIACMMVLKKLKQLILSK